MIGEQVAGQAGKGILRTNSAISGGNRWDHWLARWGVRRGEHRVAPGLYAIGEPSAESPVFVTANYTLSFDALREALDGRDSYILVLDTKGVNVWCAAGKGTFGTDELVHRVEVTGLRDVVRHRALILPQLGAPGVAAHEVKQRAGFKVEYGPVRARDLPAYLEQRKATPEMRRVSFTLAERLVLIPVELVYVLMPMVVAAVLLYLMAGAGAAGAAVAAMLAGVVLFPILLPWLPSRDFSTKGFVLGGLVALPFAIARFASGSEAAWWMPVAGGLAYLLAMPAITAFLSLNFTGSTTFTSKSGVKREIATYAPVMAATFAIGLLLFLVTTLLRMGGMS